MTPEGDLTEALLLARVRGEQLAGVAPDWQLPTLADGVQVMLAVADRLQTQWPRLGWKIAATNAEMQARMRTREPVLGMTFERFLHASPARIAHAGLLDPVIECEFAFRIGQALPAKTNGEDLTEVDVLQTVTAAYPCIEVAECRFAFQQLPAASFIQADGFASGHYVLGEAIADWPAVLKPGVGVQLFKNGALHSQGHSSDVMGHPLTPVVWLANALNRLGRQLEAGDLVSSGSCDILCRARPGDVFEARYAGLPPVRLQTP